MYIGDSSNAKLYQACPVLTQFDKLETHIEDWRVVSLLISSGH
ncbi:MAG: hypothetical protein ACI854_000818 [Arenicella sp.]|jgi:hypothetical protein